MAQICYFKYEKGSTKVNSVNNVLIEYAVCWTNNLVSVADQYKGHEMLCPYVKIV